MAANWRDYLPEARERKSLAVSAVSEVSSAQGAETGPNCTNCTNCTLPASTVAGLLKLRGMACPKSVDSAAWSCVVRDALKLSELWAEQALALGWSETDLFGAATDGNPYADGLAAWLAGRTLKALTEGWAVAVDVHGNRHFFNRPRAEGARLLWKHGR